MFPSMFHESRYLRTARTAYAARVVAAGAIVLLPAACGNGDAETFAGATVPAVTETTTLTDDTVETSTATDQTVESTAAATTTVLTPTTAAQVATAGSGFPAGGEMVVEFTYSPASTGRINNPYVAVWVEDSAGDLVQTISVWYEQSGKGTRYLRDLRSWYTASGGEATTGSGATRSAGSFAVAWDGKDLDGNAVAAGDYVLYVEAAREHGPYEITSTPFTVDGNGFTATLADNGELTALTATLTA